MTPHGDARREVLRFPRFREEKAKPLSLLCSTLDPVRLLHPAELTGVSLGQVFRSCLLASPLMAIPVLYFCLVFRVFCFGLFWVMLVALVLVVEELSLAGADLPCGWCCWRCPSLPHKRREVHPGSGLIWTSAAISCFWHLGLASHRFDGSAAVYSVVLVLLFMTLHWTCPRVVHAYGYSYPSHVSCPSHVLCLPGIRHTPGFMFRGTSLLMVALLCLSYTILSMSASVSRCPFPSSRADTPRTCYWFILKVVVFFVGSSTTCCLSPEPKPPLVVLPACAKGRDWRSLVRVARPDARFVHSSVHPSMHPSIHPPVCLSVCPSTHPPVYPSIDAPTHRRLSLP